MLEMEIGFSPERDIRIIKHKKESEFTVLYNDCINDKGLSADALAILVYVMSKPDDWEINLKNLSNRFEMGRDKVDKAIKVLCGGGYMKRAQSRVDDGSFSRLTLYASDKPVFKSQESNKQPAPEIQGVVTAENTNKQPFTEFQGTVVSDTTNKQPFTENPLTVNQGTVPYIQNKDLTKNNNNNLSTAYARANSEVEPSGGVVVFLLNKIRNLPNFDISEEQMDGWVIQYGKNYVEEKIDLMISKEKVLSQGGYLNSALRYNWKRKPLDKNMETERPLTEAPKTIPSTEYNAMWFKSLSHQEKKRIYDDAISAHNSFEEMLKVANISVLDSGFESTPWFKPVIDAFRNYNRL